MTGIATGVGVQIETATTLKFPTTPFGTTSVLPLTVTNYGVAGTITLGTSINGPSYKVLTTSQNTCLAGVATGQSCVIPIEFSPVVIGEHHDFLTLTPSGGAASSTVGLLGTSSGFGSTVEGPLVFPTIPFGTSISLPLLITNVGHTTATLETSINGPTYKVVTTPESGCSVGIANPYSCTLQIQFTPAAVGTHNDILTLTPNKAAASEVKLWGAAGPAVTYTNPVKGDIYLLSFNAMVEVFDGNGVYKSEFPVDLGDPDTFSATMAANINGVYVKGNGIDCHVDKFDGLGNYMSQFGVCQPDGLGYGAGYLNTLGNGIAVDNLSDVWVATRSTFQEFDKNGSFLSVVCLDGNASYYIPNCPVQGFNDGSILAFDSSNNLYLSDGGSEIDLYDSTGKHLSYFFLPGGSGNGQVSDEVTGMAVDSKGEIYLVDQDNNRIEVVDKNGNYLRQFGSAGTGDGQFSFASAIALDGQDNAYVTDSGNYRVQKFDSQGNYLSQFAVAPVAGSAYPLMSAISIIK